MTEEIVELLLELMGRMRAHFLETAAAFDLSPPQAGALMRLDRPLPMRALASDLHCDASNVTGLVDRLESRGLVRRFADDNDRRVKNLVLTPKGRQLRTRIRARLLVDSPVTAEMTRSQQRVFRDLLRASLGRA